MLIRQPLYLMAEGGDGAGAGEGGTGDGAAGSAGGGQAGGGEGDQGGKADEGKTFTQADVERIIAGRLSKYADYDQIKAKLSEVEAANQTEQEKAVNAARDEGRAEARRESGVNLALEVFNGAAARRNPEYDTEPALELIDLGKFVKDDGTVDRDAIKAAVERIVPEKNDPAPPSFGGGPRKQADRPDPGPGLPRLRSAYAQSSK